MNEMNEINECFHKTERSASLSRPSKKTSIMFSFDQWLMISTIITIIIVLSSTTTTMAASLLLSSMPFGQIPISHPSLMRKMNSLINDRTSTFSSSKSSTPSFETNLAINLRNDGGEIFRETIIVNRLRDYIVIDFEETDSSQIRKIIDFHNNIILYRVIHLGEQDLHEKKAELFCFMTTLPESLKIFGNETSSNVEDSSDGYVIPEIMSRLSQRNPSSIRHADFDLGEQSFEMDIEILFNEKISSIFPHLKENCDQNELLAENQNYDRNDSNQRNNHRIFANAKDLQLWTNDLFTQFLHLNWK
ncbi:cytosolic 10-formyltetrahydrofolate dehydrogenase-like [Sarcoptes scabiei]|nr:cytosolic 10-formyltetrahydrofolate dehydrogenase-like [Sarcoptes scabiei]